MPANKANVKRDPEYKQMGIEPPEGGKSLLHDEYGLPKVPKVLTNSDRDPPFTPITSDTVKVKATLPKPTKVATSAVKKGFPAASAQLNVPPPDKFGNIGMNDEHLWYDNRVTGYQEPMIDNNEEVDLDAAMSAPPQLLSKENIMHPLVERLTSIKDSVSELLPTIHKANDFSVFRANLLGKGGPIESLFKKLVDVSPNDRRIVGTALNDITESIRLELDAKEMEFGAVNEDQDTSDQDDDMKSELGEDDPVPAATPADSHSLLEVGEYMILFENNPVKVVSSIGGVRDILNQMVLGQNMNIEEIQVLKRLKIDFGILIDE